MLNTQKLLYILPDLAYIAELLPDKKPHAFSIQSFKQVNGEFFKSNKLIPEHVAKLFNKLDEGETYTIVLPDFLFTNTIVSVKETAESKIKSKLQSEVLDGLKLTPDSHLIETTSLNELKGTTRVQISAIDKSLLEVLQVAVREKGVTADAVVPLSWSIKALISLEPSISVIQIGNALYLAEHYIGVDQTSESKLDDIKKVVETVRTLKGAEPSIQTLYLLSDGKVEKTLKEELKDIVPLQQMSQKDTDRKLPSHVQVVIEAALKTLSIADFPAPRFTLGKPTDEAVSKYAAIFADEEVPADTSETDDQSSLPKPGSQSSSSGEVAAGLTAAAAATAAGAVGAASQANAAISSTGTNAIRTDVDMPTTNPKATQPDKNDLKEPEEKTVEEIEEIDASLHDKDQADQVENDEHDEKNDEEQAPADTAVADEKSAQTDDVKKEKVISEATDSDQESSDMKKDTAEVSTPSDNIDKEDAKDDASLQKDQTSDEQSDDVADEDPTDIDTAKEGKSVALSSKSIPSDEVISEKEESVDAGKIDTSVVEPAIETSVNSDEVEEIDLTQFTQLSSDSQDETSEKLVKPETESGTTTPEKQTIKNKSGVNHMLKMILITTGVFALTVAIGVGVGFAIIKYTNQGDQPAPVVEVEESPIVEATPAPILEDGATDASPSAAIDKAGLSILVVNSTTKAGYAGTVKSKLEDSDFENVTAGNSKGDYEETGIFVYLAEDDQNLVEALSEATGLDLTISDEAKVEDPQAEYDVVIVLAE